MQVLVLTGQIKEIVRGKVQYFPCKVDFNLTRGSCSGGVQKSWSRLLTIFYLQGRRSVFDMGGGGGGVIWWR